MGDYRTTKDIILDSSFYSTPDMGEYLDNDDIQKLATSIAEGDDGGAYFIESPFSTELGYHEAENVFVVSGKTKSVTDADTIDISYSSIKDGDASFVFPADGKTYNNVRDFMYQRQNLDSSVDKLPVRFLGINAPEVPHCRVTYVNEHPKIVYAKFGDLVSNTNINLYTDHSLTESYGVKGKSEMAFIYYKYTYTIDGWTVNVEYDSDRDHSDVVKFLAISADTDKGIMEVYYEVLDDDVQMSDSNSSVAYKKYAICFSHYPSSGREEDGLYNGAGTSARDTLMDLINNKAEDVIYVLDGSTFKQQKDQVPLEYRGDAIRMSDDPAYAFQFIWNQLNGVKKTYTRLGYNYFGQDYNKRALGAVYLRLNYTDEDTGKNYGSVWINAAKYLAFTYNQKAKKAGKNNTFEILPAYSTSPSIESNFNYNSSAFKMWSYDPDAQVYIDALNSVVIDDRDDIQKDIVGSDLDTLKEYTVMIGDCLLMVPPTSIRMVSQTNSQRTSLLRAKGAITKTIPKVERIIEMQLYFNGDAGINGIEYEQKTPSGTSLKFYMNGLRSLIAQFKFCPYLPIENKYINQVLNIEAVSLSSIQVNTVPGFPRTLQATIRLNDFEYRQFMPEILPPNIDNKQDFTTNLFAQTIHFPVMRYYYQRAIQNGEAASLLEFNSDAYKEATLGQNTVLQPMKFNSPLIDFYVANEEFLKLRKQLKEALEKKPFETVVTYTDTEKAFLKEVAKMYSAVTKTLYNAQSALTGLNGESGLMYVPKNSEVLDIPFSDLANQVSTGMYSNSYKTQKEIYNAYFTGIASAFNKFFEEQDTFDATIIKDHNVVVRETQMGSNEDVKVSLALKLVINWNRASADLEGKVKQDYGKQFAADTKLFLVNSAFTIGFIDEFVKGNTATSGNVKLESSGVFSSPSIVNSNLDYSNADYNLLARLANDFTSINDDSTSTLEGNDLFSQNQALAAMKDNIDLETTSSMLFDRYPIYNCIVENVSVVYNNNFNKMSLNAMHGYVSQYIGASDTMIEVNIKTRDESVVNLLQVLPRQMAELLINYRKIMTCSPLRIDCEVARLAGINEVIIESVDVNTVPNFPGLYSISLRLVSVDRTLRNREALKKIDDIDTSVTNNDTSTMSKNFFDLKNRLKQVELYPDLELPLISDIEKLGYYFIRYKNQEGRLFPDADFYFVYQHAYTSEMLKESIISFFGKSDYAKLKHQISDDLTGSSKDVTLHLSNTDDDGNTVKPSSLITSDSSDDDYDAMIKALYDQAEAAFKGSMKYVSEDNKNKIKTSEDSIKDKESALLSLQESLSASSYATYDFNHQIKLSIKDNTAFNLTKTDILKDSIKIVTADGTHDTEDADDAVTEINSSLKHLIKKELKKPISDETGIMEIIDYIVTDVLKCESTGYFQNISDNSITPSSGNISSKYAIGVDAKKFVRNNLRMALSSAATGLSAVLDFDKDDQSDNIEKWIGEGSVTITDSDGNDTSVPNVLKTVDGQDVSNYVIANGSKEIAEGIVFGPFAIKKYDPKYLGAILGVPKLTGKAGFMDPYYNKDVWNAFFADEIKDGSVDELEDDSDRISSYIDIVSDTKWDNKESIDTMGKSTVAMYRILLMWFYKLLDDDNCSMLPNAFFYLRNVTNTLSKYSETSVNTQNTSVVQKALGINNDSLYSSMNPMYWYSKGVSELGKVSASIFGSDNTKIEAEKAAEAFDQETKTAREMQTMKDDLINGLLASKINLVCGLFTTLGALAVGEYNTPIYPAVAGGNLSDFTNYVEQIKAAYLDYDKLSEVDVKMRKFFAYLDRDEYNNKTSWNKKVDPLKKYGITSLVQRKYLEIADIPQIYLLHSFYDMVAHDMRGRMARAFPTYYMLLIDEGRDLGMWHLQDNFYDVSSISEFQVVKSRKIAADTASIVMTNLFGTFTSEDEDMKDEYQYTFKDAWNSIFSPRPYYLKEYNRRQNARDFNRAKLKPGARVHLRMGYEGDASRIPIMFNGAVAEVATQDDMINIICQGDGVELANPDMFNAADVDDVADLKYTEDMLGGLYGMFNSETTPRDVLVNPLISSGSWIRSVIKDWSNSRFFNDNPFGIVHFGDKYYHEVFQNSGEMEQNIYEALSKPSWGYAGEANFNESLWAMESAPKIKVGLEGKKSYWDLMGIAASVAPEYISAVVPFQLRSSIFYGAPRYYYAYDYEKTSEGKIVEKRKPFQQYHIYTSYSDIIGNKIAASDKDIRTCAVGIYQGNGWLETTNQSVGPMWLDIDIYPENQKMTTINCDFTHRSFNLPFTIPVVSKTVEFFKEDAYKVAWRATANGLKSTVKDMYTGELIVMGDPTIKPYDKMMVYDTYTDIQGVFDVEAVVHTFSVDTGFVTSISPDCVVAVDDKYEKVAHNGILEAVRPALINAATVCLLSQRFANVTRSMFFSAAQAIKSGTDYASGVANGVKTVIGSEDVATYGSMAEKVLGEVAPIFGATASDFVIYSSINALTKAYEALPTSHTLASGSDLIKFLTDVKNQPDLLASVDPSKLKADLQEALANTSNLKTSAKTQIEATLKELDSFGTTYAKVATSNSFTIDYDFISEIIKEIPEGKVDDLMESINYLNELEKTGIVSGSKNFEEAMTHLIKVAGSVDDLTATSTILTSAKSLDSAIFTKTANSLSSFDKLATTLAEVNTVKKGAGAIKSFLSSNLIWLAAQIVITKYVQEYIERKLKNLQVLTVFPVMKNNLVMTAGLNGNKGSVFDSPTYNEAGFLEEMAGNFFDGKYGTTLPFIMDCLFDTSDMRNIVNNYKRDSAYENGSAEVLKDTYTNKLLNNTALQDVKGIEAYREMFLVPRVVSATDDDAKVAFASSKFVDIEKPATNASIDANLIYIFQEDYLKKLNANDDPSKRVLLFSAQQNTNAEDSSGNSIDTYWMQVKSSSEGTKDLNVKCKKIAQGGNELAIYDIPMLRKDGVTVMSKIIRTVVDAIQPDADSSNSTLDELHKHNIIIHNATRINDKKSWYCTGYSFTIQVKDYTNFGNILEKLHSDQPVIKNDDGTVVKAWNYKEDTSFGNNTYRVMVMPPK